MHLSLQYCVVVVSAFLTPTIALAAENIPVAKLGTKYELIGKLHNPLGKYIFVQGVAVEGPFKGYEGGPSLRPQRIQNRATQEDIQIGIAPFDEWGKKAYGTGVALPKLEFGKTYEMEGYETGGFVGVPGDALDKSGVSIQTVPHYLRTKFVVVKAHEIAPVHLSPREFTGRNAMFQGIAITVDGKALMKGKNWEVIVNSKAGWPDHVEGKLVETSGMYNPTEDREQFTLLEGTARLVRLEDQLGQKVELRGRGRSLNDVWWFHYRGTDLYVDKMADLPGWTPDNHWRPIVIRGTLEKARLPRLDQVSEKEVRDLKDYYIVRNASWEPLAELYSPERPFGEPQ